MLSRTEMVDIIVNRKESVILNGRIIDKVSDLPTEAELALGDEKREAAAKSSLEAQIKELQAQVALLDKPAKAETKVETKAEAEVEAKDKAAEDVKEKVAEKETKSK